MNERIQSLIEQARVNDRGYFIYQYGGPNGHQSVEQAIDLEQFAKLIVRECCDVLHDNEMGGYQVNYVLKEHFGVEQMKQEPLMFAGVPLVRVVKIERRWQVQERTSEDTEDWTNIGPTFATSEEALDAAPELCEF